MRGWKGDMKLCPKYNGGLEIQRILYESPTYCIPFLWGDTRHRMKSTILRFTVPHDFLDGWNILMTEMFWIYMLCSDIEIMYIYIYRCGWAAGLLLMEEFQLVYPEVSPIRGGGCSISSIQPDHHLARFSQYHLRLHTVFGRSKLRVPFGDLKKRDHFLALAEVPSWKLISLQKCTFEDDFPFPQVGYVSSLGCSSGGPIKFWVPQLWKLKDFEFSFHHFQVYC